MKSLPTLIKLAHQKLEEQQRRINEVEQQIADIKAEQARLEQSASAGFEIAAAEADKVLLEQAGRYAKHSRSEKEQAAAIEAKLTVTLERLQAQLRTLFGEQKRHEILLENYEREIAKQRAKKQQAQLDDISNTRAVRAQRD